MSPSTLVDGIVMYRPRRHRDYQDKDYDSLVTAFTFLWDATTETILTSTTRLIRHRACVLSGRRYLPPLPYHLYLQTAPSWDWIEVPQK
jgi:hypothetical protein